MDRSAERFIEDIICICEEYGFSLAHEDTQGGFVIEEYKEKNIEWLKEALLYNNRTAK